MDTIIFTGLLSTEGQVPLLYDSYMNGGFVVNTTKKGSGIPYDQALEQCCQSEWGDNRSHQEEGCICSMGNYQAQKRSIY